MNRKPLLIVSLIVLLAFLSVMLYQHQHRARQVKQVVAPAGLVLPELSDTSYNWIGSRIYQNEAAGQVDKLTYWGAGEDFPSMGIGHFIWFPQGVDAPFDEQFPELVAFIRQQASTDVAMPAWLQQLDPFDAPWSSKEQFDQAWSSTGMSELRTWLENTQHYQARFIVSSFEKRWYKLDLPEKKRQDFNGILEQLVKTPEGLFALVDYYNFKGLGNNPRESYQGEGWGLLQVLETMQETRVVEGDCIHTVEEFRDAAADRLRLRVEFAPAERNEARWLPGWLKRLNGYLPGETVIDEFSGCGFRVTPYLQNPSADAMTISWLSHANQPGLLSLWKSDTEKPENALTFESRPVLAGALVYQPQEDCGQDDCFESSPPFLHQVRVTDLEPGSLYNYRVKQSRQEVVGSFSTMSEGSGPLRFIVYGDSETEPESSGKHAAWPGNELFGMGRRYPVDQTTGYAQNLKVITERQPAFIAIAGDLVQSGGEQRDWDEFWVHNAPLAASSVILPALGNHDYYAGPGDLGRYETNSSERAVRKYQTYFDLPDNGAGQAVHSERYYALQYGPVSLIVLDTTDGQPHRSEQDTNWRLLGENDGGFAPDWHPGSEQYAWLEKQLQKAQATSHFTFVMFHGAPYTSGVHGQRPGEGSRKDILSAVPIQALTPLFHRYGVDAVFNGHDEMYEHSLVTGLAVLADGSTHEHGIHFLDVGIGGDGLRGPLESVSNPHRIFLAHVDAPEVYGSDGVLSEGGKHYGHMEINVEKNAGGLWKASFDPVYIFPLIAKDGQVVGFERRIYKDSFTLIENNLE